MTYLGGDGDKHTAYADYPTHHPISKAQIVATGVNSGHDTSKDYDIEENATKL